MIRVFFALSISELLARQLSLHADGLLLQLPRETLHWVPSENYHITLAFLGDVESRDIPRLESIAAEVAAHHSFAELSIDDVVWFPSIHKPRLLVALIKPHAALKKLHADLQRQLRLQGFSVDNRRFIPHISLARARRDQQAKKFQLVLEDLTTEMDELVLFQSRLTPKGSRYSPLTVHLLR